MNRGSRGAALDWDDLRCLLAPHRMRTLSAAAEILRVTQSTVGGRLERLESCLGVRLMDRTPDGYFSTVVDKGLLGEVARVECGVAFIQRVAGERDVRLEGA